MVERVLTRAWLTLKPDQRFWLRVQYGPDCWEWTGERNRAGYGLLMRGGLRHRSAHRVAWELAYGPIPDGLFVCHHCDNPPCVRPDHLFIGTQADNLADMDRKGRRVRGYGNQQGVNNGNAKLDDGKVRLIRSLRADGYSLKAIGQATGVHFSNVSAVLKGKTWRHVD